MGKCPHPATGVLPNSPDDGEKLPWEAATLTRWRASDPPIVKFPGEIDWATALTPLLLAVPLVTFFSYVSEIIFAGQWARRVIQEGRLAQVLYLPRSAE